MDMWEYQPPTKTSPFKWKHSLNAECETIRQKKVSTTSIQGRDERNTQLEFLRDGEKLVITRIDRLARSIRDLQNIVYDLDTRGVTLSATEQPINTKTSAGKCFLDMFGVFGEFETNLRKERQMLGILRVPTCPSNWLAYYLVFASPAPINPVRRDMNSSRIYCSPSVSSSGYFLVRSIRSSISLFVEFRRHSSHPTCKSLLVLGLLDSELDIDGNRGLTNLLGQQSDGSYWWVSLVLKSCEVICFHSYL